MENAELDRLARMGAELPNCLEQPEQLYYLSVRQLYWFFDKGALDTEQAKREKKKLLDQLEVNRLKCSGYKELCRIRIRMAKVNLRIAKEGCPLCKETAKILDGLI